MYTNNEVKGYLAVRIVGDQLKPGWLETGIMSKGINGSLGSKPNQVDFVIPLSSTIRSVIDRGLSDSGDSGFIIYGESGLTEEKFVVSFKIHSENDETTRDFIAFRITNYSPYDIARLVLKYDMGVELSGEYLEPRFDYIDYFSEQGTSNDIVDGFSLSMPSNWSNPRGWIPELLNSTNTDAIILKLGSIHDSIALSLLFSNWVLEMVENLLIRDPVASCFLLRGIKIESFLWDGPRDIMTSIITRDIDAETLATQILNPLWAKSDELLAPSSKTKEVVVREESLPIKDDEQKRMSSKEKKLLSKVEYVLHEVDVNDTLRRIERAEAILSELERISTMKEDEPPERPNHLESRLKETLDRLESLTERLAALEKRIQKICDSIR